jgi:hypothetical protein
MVSGWTRDRVTIDGEYSGKIFDTDLSVVPGDLYTMTLTRPRVTCRRYSTAEYNVHDIMLEDYEKFIPQSEQDRKTISSWSLVISSRLAKGSVHGNCKVSKKSSKDCKDQTNDIEQSELSWRKLQANVSVVLGHWIDKVHIRLGIALGWQGKKQEQRRFQRLRNPKRSRRLSEKFSSTSRNEI